MWFTTKLYQFIFTKSIGNYYINTVKKQVFGENSTIKSIKFGENSTIDNF